MLLKQNLLVQIRVFADHVVETSEVATGITKIGIYELHDLVLLEYELLFSFMSKPSKYCFLSGLKDVLCMILQQ